MVKDPRQITLPADFICQPVIGTDITVDPMFIPVRNPVRNLYFNPAPDQRARNPFRFLVRAV